MRRYSKAYNVLVLLCSTALISACELSPTSFDGELTSSFPLHRIDVNKVSMFVGTSGYGQGYCLPLEELEEIDPTFFDSFHSFSGTLDKIEETWYLSLSLEANYESDSLLPPFIFPDPQPLGFSVNLSSLEISGNVDGHSELTRCPDGSGRITIAQFNLFWNPNEHKLDPYWDGAESIDATLDLVNLNIEEISTEEVKATGELHLYARHKRIDAGGGGQRDDMIYTMEVEFEIE